jgi:phage shock protein A
MELQMEINAAEEALETRLSALEDRIGELTAKLDEIAARNVSASATHATESITNVRKTLPTQMTTLLAKQGVAVDASLASIEAGTLDQALTSLSIEQRIAVKAQLLRAGMLH